MVQSQIIVLDTTLIEAKKETTTPEIDSEP